MIFIYTKTNKKLEKKERIFFTFRFIAFAGATKRRTAQQLCLCSHYCDDYLALFVSVDKGILLGELVPLLGRLQHLDTGRRYGYSISYSKHIYWR